VYVNIAEHTLMAAVSQGKGLQWTQMPSMVQDKGSALDSTDHGTRHMVCLDSSDHRGSR